MQDVVANSSNCDTVSKMVGSHGADQHERAFSLDEMASFFFIILIGHCIATAGFVLEGIKKRCCGNGQTDGIIIREHAHMTSAVGPSKAREITEVA